MLSLKQLQVEEVAAWEANGLIRSEFPGEALEKTYLARMWWTENFRVGVEKVSATDALFGCVVSLRLFTCSFSLFAEARRVPPL